MAATVNAPTFRNERRPDGSATSWCGVLDMMGLTAAAPVATVTEGSDFPR